MKASKFSEAQIAFVLKQAEDGAAVAEVCRKAGISQATYFNWKKKYAGLMPSEMKRLRQLEEENAKLKRIVADLSLDKAVRRGGCSRVTDCRLPLAFILIFHGVVGAGLRSITALWCAAGCFWLFSDGVTADGDGVLLLHSRVAIGSLIDDSIIEEIQKHADDRNQRQTCCDHISRLPTFIAL